MSFDSSVDALLYYMGCGGIFYSYLEMYDKYIWMSDIERVWREHGCPVLVYDMVTVRVVFHNTTCGWPLSYWDYPVLDMVRGFSNTASRNSSYWFWRTCLGVRGYYNEDDNDIESFLREVRGYLSDGFTVGLFSALYIYWAVLRLGVLVV